MNLFNGAMKAANDKGVGIMGTRIDLPGGDWILATKDIMATGIGNTAGGRTSDTSDTLYVRVDDADAKAITQGMIVVSRGERMRIARIGKIDSYYSLTLGPVDAAGGPVDFLQ